MYLFLGLVLPFILFLPCYLRKSYKEYVLPVCLGLVFGIAICLFNTFFIFSASYYELDFGGTFLRILLKSYLLPLLGTGCVFFVITKDSLVKRFKGLFPMWTAFYGVAMPFFTVSGKTEFSIFELFVRPLLTASFLLLICTFINLLVKEFEAGKPAKNILQILVLGLLIAVAVVVAVLDEALWFVGGCTLGWVLVFLAYSAAAVFFCLKTKLNL